MIIKRFCAVGVLMLFLGMGYGCGYQVKSKALQNNIKQGETKMLKATFAAGCFWGVEETFRTLEGVSSTSVGYTGGIFNKPTYEEVCSGMTRHAEAVEVIYDPATISYEELLDVFWQNHNPTTKNRQGQDRGSQYRSAIFYHSEAQKQAAIESKRKLAEEGVYKDPIVTEITPAKTFYKAEEYHQKYYLKNGGACSI